MALQAILASPKFLFRIEETPTIVKAGDVYRISDLELATRLSFFLWGSGHRRGTPQGREGPDPLEPPGSSRSR